MEELSLFSVPQPKVYTVSEITEAIKQILESEFPLIWVEGEISNARCPLSGHFYFTLKDEKAQLGAVLFKGQRRWLKFEPEDGLKVICQGRITVYPPHGNYRLIVEYIEPKGYGALQLAFEQLKKRLEKEGLFAEAEKKSLPLLPRRIAVVTSPVGAAIRDFLRVLLKKFPNVNVRIYPVKVQGEDAAQEIARAIYDLNRLGWPEVIVVTRGGGSLEDLWAFNEEIVARAIYASDIPVVSAVGHEVDFTISDMVADLRAPTPTAAAEMIIQKKEDIENFLTDSLSRLPRALKKQVETQKLNLNHLLKRLGSSKQRLDYYRLQLDDLSQSLFKTFAHIREKQRTKFNNLVRSLSLCHPKRQLQQYREQLQQKQKEISLHFLHLLQQKQQYLHQMQQSLNALSPLNVLKRGYALAFTFPERRLIKSITQATPNMNILVRVADGEIKAKVEDKNESIF
ncbi:MAG: exodeoxyribonuclease VII large subunit [Candidatus Desulfofervidaceae bacterium]|nr:exodeoxyribonuclease VII large subunit [Candidatus Desulfofervidaceae bacterium]